MALLPDKLPGEQLLIKMWQSLVDNGLGGLLTPWQVRRTGIAQNEVEGHRIRVLAQAVRDAQDIGDRRKNLTSEGLLVDASPKPEGGLPSPEAFIEGAIAAEKDRAVRRLANLSEIVGQAEAEVEAEATSEAPINDTKVDPDWFARWRSNAEDVSSELLQQLWARILVGEVAKPGLFSLRTLDLVRNLSLGEAKLIESFAKYVFDDRCVVLGGRPGYNFLTANGISIDDIMALRDLGIIGEISIDAGEAVTVENRGDARNYQGVLIYLDKAFVIIGPDSGRKLELPVFALTKVGRDVYSLVRDLNPEENYIRAIADYTRSRGFTFRLGNATPMGKAGIYSIKNIRDY